MSKQLKTLVIMLACAAVLALGYYLAVTFIIPNKDNAGKIPLFSTERENIQNLEINNINDSFTLEKSGDKWQIKGHEAIPLGSNEISLLLIKMRNIAANKVVEEKPKDISKYGFDSPIAKVKINLADGKSFSYEIGAETPVKDGYYLRRENDEAVYLVSTEFGRASIDGAVAVIDKLLFELVPYEQFTEVNYLKISGEKRGEYPINMYLKDKKELEDPSVVNVFELRGNYSYNIGIEEGENLLKKAFSLSQADEAIAYDADEKTLAEYGFDKPSYIMEFAFQSKPCKVIFGRADADGSYFAMLDGRNVIYRYKKDRLAFLDTKAKDIIERMVMLRAIEQIDTLTVITGGQEYTFKVSGDSKNLTVNYNGTELDSANFKTYYQVILQTRYEDLIEQPVGVEPMLSIRYKFRDGREELLEFVPVDPRKCFAFINGKGDFYVFRTEVDKIAADTLKVIKGEKVVTTW